MFNVNEAGGPKAAAVFNACRATGPEVTAVFNESGYQLHKKQDMRHFND